MPEESWLCQEYTKLAERVNRISDMMERLGVTNSGQRGKLFGATWEVSQNHIATWDVASSLPLTSGEDTYARLRGGELEISTGKGAHMEMTAEYMRTWNSADTKTLDIDFTTGDISLIGTIYRPNIYRLDEKAIWIENSAEAYSWYGLRFAPDIDIESPNITGRIGMYQTDASYYMYIESIARDTHHGSFLLLRAWDDSDPGKRTALQIHSASSVGFKVYGDNVPELKWNENGFDMEVQIAAGRYLNWGAITGINGYGFRDNAGTLEWKNSGGTWATFGGMEVHALGGIYHTADTLANLNAKITDADALVARQGGNVNVEYDGGGDIWFKLTVADPDPADQPIMVFNKARGNLNSPALISSGDILGIFYWQGYDGGGYFPAAAMRADAAGAWDTNDHPGKLVFLTVPDGSNIQLERLTVKSNGYVRIHEGQRIDAGKYLNWGATEGIDGYGFRDNAGTLEWKNSGGSWAAFGTGGGMEAHLLGGIYHTADTLANLNAKITDATLDDIGNARTPTVHAASHQNGGSDEINVAGLSGLLADAQTPIAHALGSVYHIADTLANLNAKITNATLDDSGDSRTPIAHDLFGTLHNAGTLAALNAKVTDATLDDIGNARTPTTHDLFGALHNAGTLAALNAKITDANVDDKGNTRIPEVSGTYYHLYVDIGPNSLNSRLQYAGTADQKGIFHFMKSRGTIASPTNVASGDGLGIITFEGYYGGNNRLVASIESQAAATWATNDYPANLIFYTTEKGESSWEERMRIDADGFVRVREGVFVGDGTPNINAFDKGVFYARRASNNHGYFIANDSIILGGNAYCDDGSWKTLATGEGILCIIPGPGNDSLNIYSDATSRVADESRLWKNILQARKSGALIVGTGGAADAAKVDGSLIASNATLYGYFLCRKGFNFAADGYHDGSVWRSMGDGSGKLIIVYGSSAGQLSVYTDPTARALGDQASPSLRLRMYETGQTKIGGNWLPMADNAYHLGSDALEWIDVWAYDTSINHSDARDKRDIQDEPLGLDFIRRLKPRGFRWNHGKRQHHGFVGQEVKQVLDEMGIDTEDAAMYVYAPPKHFEREKDELFGVDIEERDKPGSHHLRYSEFIAPLAKAVQELAEENDRLKKRVSTLEERLDKLERRLLCKDERGTRK